MAFFYVLLTEFFLKNLGAITFTLYYYCKGKMGGEASSNNWKPEFDVSEEVVWLLYYQSLIWVGLIFFPFMAFIAPAFIVI